jgi:hypothetical protein
MKETQPKTQKQQKKSQSGEIEVTDEVTGEKIKLQPMNPDTAPTVKPVPGMDHQE